MPFETDIFTPGLIRMIVVNTDFLPRRAEEIPLDGHAAIIAENGFGKTSLIQLLPLFYGEEMRKLVSSSERKSFIEFYLPTNASYIAFEYRNFQGALRSVVIHSDPQKKRLQYRFIRGPLSKGMFTIEMTPGRTVFVETNDFPDHIRRTYGPQGIEISNIVDATRAYRGIIQGRVDPAASTDGKVYLRRLMSDYAMADTKAPMIGVEQLLTQMLRNNVSMKTMLSMVALQAVEGVDGPVQILGNQRSGDVANWPRDYAAYKRVMVLEPEAKSLFVKSDTLISLKEDLKNTYDILAAHLEDQKKNEEDLVSLKKSERDDQQRRDAELSETIDHLRGEVARLRGEIRNAETRISEIDRDEQALRARGAEEAELSAGKLPELRAAEDLARTRLADLNRDGRDISETHARNRADILQAHAELRDVLKEERDALGLRSDAAETEIRELSDAAESEADLQTQGGLEEIERDLSDLQAAETDLVRRHAAVGPDDSFVERDAAIRKALLQDEETALRTERDLTEARKSENAARLAHDAADQRVNEALRICAAADQKHGDAIDAKNPKDGTLLAYLRREFPAWGQDIGKVIRPDLLHRKDLSPAAEAGASIFGLSLELSSLRAPEVADREILDQRIEEANEERGYAKRTLDSCQETLRVAAEALKKARDDLSRSEADSQLAQDRVIRARNGSRGFAAEMEAHLVDRRASLGLALATQTERLRVKKEQKASFVQARRIVLQNIREQRVATIQQLKTEQGAAQAALNERLLGIASSETRALSQNDEDRDVAARAKGIDPQSIRAADAEISRLLGLISAALKSQDLAREWRSFQEDRYGERNRLRGHLSSLKSDISGQENGLKSAEIGRKEQADRHRALVEGLELDIDQCRENLSGIEARLAKCPKDIMPVAHRGPGFDQGHRKAITDIGAIETRLNILNDEITALVRKIIAAFRRSDSKISAYVTDQVSGLGEFGPDWVPLIANWFNHAHEDHRTALAAGIQAVAQPIRMAYGNLLEADRSIISIGRKLSRAIRENAGFPHVQNVDILLKSSIRSQKFWEDLVNFDESYDAWRRESGTVPPEDMILSLERLLGHWKDGETAEIRLEDMLYIEGSMVERGNLRHFNRKTDLSDLSSNGNVMVLRLILFTGLLSVMRQGRPIRMTWAVDEIGALDPKNTISTLEMLGKNGISLLTAAPMLDRSLRLKFDHYLRIEKRQIYRIAETAETGIREWDEDGNLGYPKHITEEDAA